MKYVITGEDSNKNELYIESATLEAAQAVVRRISAHCGWAEITAVEEKAPPFNMREWLQFQIDEKLQEARGYAADDFLDKNPANIEEYDKCFEVIGFMEALLRGGVVMGSAI